MQSNLSISKELADISKLDRQGVVACYLGINNWREQLLRELQELNEVREIRVSEGSKIREFNRLDALPKESLLRLIAETFLTQKFSFQVNFDTIYHVVDDANTQHRNQKFHFDTIPCVKLILNLDVEQSSVTEFIPGSHRKVWPRINGILFKYSRGRLKLASKGTEFLPGHKKLIAKEKLSFYEEDGSIFLTNIYHRAGTKVIKGRQIVIITLRIK